MLKAVIPVLIVALAMSYGATAIFSNFTNTFLIPVTCVPYNYTQSYQVGEIARTTSVNPGPNSTTLFSVYDAVGIFSEIADLDYACLNYSSKYLPLEVLEDFHSISKVTARFISGVAAKPDGSYVVAAVVDGYFYKIPLSPDGRSFDLASSTMIEANVYNEGCETALLIWRPGYVVDSYTTVHEVTVNSLDTIIVDMRFDDQYGNLRWRLYAMDLLGIDCDGDLYHISPLNAEEGGSPSSDNCTWPLVHPHHTTLGNVTFSVDGSLRTHSVIEFGIPSTSIYSYGTNATNFTYSCYTGGIPESDDLYVIVQDEDYVMFETGSSLITRSDPKNPSWSGLENTGNIELEIEGFSFTRTTRMVLDEYKEYIFLGDGLGNLHQFDIQLMRERVPSSQLLTAPGHTLSVFALFGHEMYLLAEDKSTEEHFITGYYSYDCFENNQTSCEVCHETGGKYCVWNYTTGECRLEHSPDEIHSCSVLSGPYPASVPSLGSSIEINSDFYPVEYSCHFYYNGSLVGASSGSFVGGNTTLNCSTPQISVSGLEVEVVTAEANLTFGDRRLDLSLYECTYDAFYECTIDDKPECGYCGIVNECGTESSCSNSSSFSSSVPAISELSQSLFASTKRDIFTVKLSSELYPSTFTYKCMFSMSNNISESELLEDAVIISSNELNCTSPLVSKAKIYIFIVANDTLLTNVYEPIFFYDCSLEHDCGSCISESRPHCMWSLETMSCSTNDTLFLTYTCPSMVSGTPSTVPSNASIGITLTLSTLFNSTLFSVEVESGSLREVVPATFAGGNSLYFSLPVLPAETSAQLEVLYNGTYYTTSAFALSVYTCEEGTYCGYTSCSSIGSGCGWCLEDTACVYSTNCGGSNTFIVDEGNCPSVSTVYPFSGSIYGGTNISVTGSYFYNSTLQGDEYSCRFIFDDSTTGETPAELVSSTEISCQSPESNVTGFNQLQIILGEKIYTPSTRSYVFYDCGVYNSCSECLESKKKDCGWCLTENKCSTSYECDVYNDTEYSSLLSSSNYISGNEFISDLDECPVVLGITTYAVFTDISIVEYVILNKLPGSLEGWECGFASDTQSVRVPGTYVSETMLMCVTPKNVLHGSALVSIYWEDKLYARSTSYLIFEEPKYFDEIRIFPDIFDWWSWVNTIVGYGLVILTTLGLVPIFVFLFTIIYARKTPVVRQASPFFCYLMLVGGIIGIASNYLYIFHPFRLLCLVRPIPLLLGTTLLFGSLFVKTYRVYRIFNNPHLRRVRLRNRQLVVVLVILVVIDACILTVWYVLNAPDSDYVYFYSTDTQVVRCQSTFQWFFVIPLLFVRVLFVIAGCILAIITRNVISEFNESKFIAISMYNIGIVGIIGFPVIAFAGLREVFNVFIWCLCILLMFDGPIFLVFFPKFYIIFFNKKKNVKPKAIGSVSTSISIRERIALKRGETQASLNAKKAMTGSVPASSIAPSQTFEMKQFNTSEEN